VAYNGRVGVEVEELVAKAATGDEEAWSALWSGASSTSAA
jgi:hypothetical protein